MLKQIAVIGALLVVDIAHAAVLDTKPVGEENFEQSKTYDSDSSSNNAEPATRGKQSYVRHALASSEEADTLHAVYPGRHYGHGHGHSVASSEEAGTAGIVHAVYPGRHYGHGHTVASSDEAGTVYAVHPRRHYGHGHKEASSEEADTAAGAA
ncbi:uncharacterized protein LOC113203955 isoform X2 [Frankliniella occidentalis]|uniref:Uncharacterized protein LOC113203955 isoform X2 n=1 Tax=Frankliniella occidentalis TaxID=133901 RepID=A0A9C6UB46_FRAOC|nr:uncharacterized protein LOC113203955 isoform X2 [Frankliniella occidentalis]